MSGKIRVFSILLVAATVALLGSLVIQRTEGQGKSKDIQLTAIIRSLGTDKIQDDGLGPYISGITPAGTVEVHLSQRSNSMYFYVDKGTNPQSPGRFVGLSLDDPITDYPCPTPTMECCPDFPFAYAYVEPQIFRMGSGWTFFPDANDPDRLIVPNVAFPDNLDFMKMGMTVKEGKKTITYPTHAYVGLGINFYLTVDGDKHILGGGEYAAEVFADDIGPSGPRHWTVKSLNPPWHYWADIKDDDRQLYRGYQEFKTSVRCSYGRFNFPFQIELYRQ